MFENVDTLDTKSDIANYLALYSDKPITKDEMMDKIFFTALQQVDLSKLYTVRRMGKDTDPMFYTFGKIHGLENIAFADPAEIKETNGNPVKI